MRILINILVVEVEKISIFFAIFLCSSVDSIAVQLLDEKIKTASIPDITGDADTPVGHVSYSLSRYVNFIWCRLAGWTTLAIVWPK